MISEISQSVLDIQAERNRQVSKGYTYNRDDLYDDGALADAGAALAADVGQPDSLAFSYDTDRDWVLSLVTHVKMKHTKRQQLIIAAALIAAEIDRGDRKNGGPNW